MRKSGKKIDLLGECDRTSFSASDMMFDWVGDEEARRLRDKIVSNGDAEFFMGGVPLDKNDVLKLVSKTDVNVEPCDSTLSIKFDDSTSAYEKAMLLGSVYTVKYVSRAFGVNAVEANFLLWMYAFSDIKPNFPSGTQVKIENLVFDVVQCLHMFSNKNVKWSVDGTPVSVLVTGCYEKLYNKDTGFVYKIIPTVEASGQQYMIHPMHGCKVMECDNRVYYSSHNSYIVQDGTPGVLVAGHHVLPRYVKGDFIEYFMTDNLEHKGRYRNVSCVISKVAIRCESIYVRRNQLSSNFYKLECLSGRCPLCLQYSLLASGFKFRSNNCLIERNNGVKVLCGFHGSGYVVKGEEQLYYVAEVGSKTNFLEILLNMISVKMKHINIVNVDDTGNVGIVDITRIPVLHAALSSMMQMNLNISNGYLVLTTKARTCDVRMNLRIPLKQINFFYLTKINEERITHFQLNDYMGMTFGEGSEHVFKCDSITGNSMVDEKMPEMFVTDSHYNGKLLD